ncbi:hypothetical protein SAMN05443668_110328 [Cryptosporangium aurantiacum]|uniref:Uncharacterized protein n=1 Tax=Cryptosporangium aurantiacum TaxID=134849 RepID=A0A1M7REI2_9ACTN|nr:hypothetical protein SAMN05443668_110328 [Cryptosporangium aurantiacum]
MASPVEHGQTLTVIDSVRISSGVHHTADNHKSPKTVNLSRTAPHLR